MRFYRRWAGNNRGTPEDKTRCVVSVADGGRSVLSHQCERKRGKGTGDLAGLLCGIHAALQAKGRGLYVPEEGNKP